MNFLFIDESKSNSKRFFITGGVCIDEIGLQAISKTLASVRQTYSIPMNCELRWATRRLFLGSTHVKTLDEIEHDDLRCDILRSVQESNATVFGGVLDKENYNNWSDAQYYLHSIEVMCTKYQYFLQDKGGELGVVIADHLDSNAENRKARIALARIYREGGMWATLDNVILNPILYHSDQIPALQIADFIAGALNFKINRAKDQFYRIIEPSIRRSPSGQIEGYGISFIPTTCPRSNWP
ncbi:MAG: DUF3800 domain-containing protein [Candidatus Paceibacterota bacterium]